MKGVAHDPRVPRGASGPSRVEVGESGIRALPLIERAILAVAPKWGLERARARAVAGLLARRYEGASRGRRTDDWQTSGSSANAETFGALAVLRNRSRDLVRNNRYATRAIRSSNSDNVGTGIRPVPMLEDDGDRAELLQYWEAWAGTTACDADEQQTFYGMMSLSWREVTEAGEVLLRRRWRRPSDDLPVPLQLQLMEADHLDTSMDGTSVTGKAGKIIQGVQFNSLGRRTGYWLFPDHPGELGGFHSGRFHSQKVPARELLHLYRVDRVGQVRGVPWLAPAMITLRDYDAYEDAQLMRQRIAACYTAFVHDIDSGVESASPSADELAETMEPGLIEYLPAGKEISFADPPGVEGYKDFAEITIRGIARAAGVTYESLSGDLSRTNFTSGRMGRLDVQAEVDQNRQFILIPRYCKPIWNWFMAAGALAGIPVFLKHQGLQAYWTPSRREQLDPVRETTAIKSKIRMGISSLSDAIRAEGRDPETLLRELAKDRDLLKELGLTLDSVLSAPQAGRGNGDAEAPKGEK